MATDVRLRRDLLAQMRVSSQRLYQLVRARKSELPMSTEQAIYTLAHERGLDISKYLTNDETTEVRALVAQLRVAGSPMAARGEPDRRPQPGRVAQAIRPARRVVVTIAGMKVDAVPGPVPNACARGEDDG